MQPSLLSVKGHTVVAVVNPGSGSINTTIEPPLAKLEELEIQEEPFFYHHYTEHFASDQEFSLQVEESIQNICVGEGLETEQIDRLRSLLLRFSSCFQTDSLGMCSLFQHKIV